MNTLKRIVLGLLLLVIIAGIVVYFNLNRIIRSTIETQSTNSLNLQTTLASANLGLLGGKLSLGDLRIASPQGFNAPQLMTLGEGNINVSYGQLRAEPIHIVAITLDKPVIMVEQSGGKFNFQVVAAALPKPDPNAREIKLIIDKLTVKDATVVLRPGIPGLKDFQEVKVPIPNLELKNIGNADGQQNGAAIKEVVTVLLTSLVDKAGQASNLSTELQDALKGGVAEAEGKIRERVNEEVSKQLGEVDKRLKGTPLEGKTGDLLKGLTGSKDDKKEKKKN